MIYKDSDIQKMKKKIEQTMQKVKVKLSQC